MESPNRATTLVGSFRCALAGVWRALRTERNLKIQVTAAIVVATAAAVLRCSLMEWALLVLAMGLVLVAETLNTAAEAIVDLVSPDYHELARIAKDVAAGAVLLAAATSVVVGVLILGPHLMPG